LLGIFAGLALVLAAIGIYGVMAYLVNQGTREIGIRMAIGATQREIVRLVVFQGMTLAVAGVSIGLAAAFVFARLMRSLLFGISAADPLTFAGISLLLTFVALLATYIPARRAASIPYFVSARNDSKQTRRAFTFLLAGESRGPSAQTVVISLFECLKAGGHPDVSMTNPPEETPPARR